MYTIKASTLESLTTDIFSSCQCAPEVASQVSRSLVRANLSGHESHGVIRIPSYVRDIQAGILQPNVPLSVTNETASLVVADGQHGFGQTQIPLLLDRVIPKSRNQGVACGVMNHCGHIGQLSPWVEHAADQGFAALLTVNDNGTLRAVAPPGGTRPILSTNPLAIATPGDPEAMVVDLSTSIVANGKILVAHEENQSVPEGWLLDENGAPTTDPGVRYRDPPGSLLPFGGYKGFGLALLLDILVSGLTGGYCPPAPTDAVSSNNVLLILWDPEQFHGVKHIVQEAQRLEQFIRDSPVIDPDSKITLPHDRSRRTRKKRATMGIPIGDQLHTQLTELAGELRVHLPDDWPVRDTTDPPNQ